MCNEKKAWKYNAQNAPGYEKKWRIDLVWKWQHGVLALDFAMNFVNVEKNITIVIITYHALYPNPNDGWQYFFCQTAKGYWNRTQKGAIKLTRITTSVISAYFFTFKSSNLIWC
jgi:hypothetical protein